MFRSGGEGNSENSLLCKPSSSGPRNLARTWSHLVCVESCLVSISSNPDHRKLAVLAARFLPNEGVAIAQRRCTMFDAIIVRTMEKSSEGRGTRSLSLEWLLLPFRATGEGSLTQAATRRQLSRRHSRKETVRTLAQPDTAFTMSYPPSSSTPEASKFLYRRWADRALYKNRSNN